MQRVPKTESQGRVHTSIATVAVLPEAEDVDINIDQKDRALQVIEKLRVLIPKMAKEDQDKCMQYVKNLTTLSIHYFNA